jgi:Flp pilus assembly protein TadD
VKVWDADTWQELFTLRGHTDTVWSVAFGPNGRLASGGGDHTVRVWDADTGAEIYVLRGHAGSVRSVAFGSDGRLASAGDDHTVHVWDTATGQPLRVLRGHTAEVSGLAFSRDARRLASGGTDQTVKIWDMATGQELLTLTGHRGAVLGVAFDPDGLRLASAGEERTVKIWDASALTPELAVERQARSLVQFLFERPLLRRDVVERIRADETVAEAGRTQALALAEHYPEDARCLCAACRAVVCKPGLEPDQYRLALSRAEAAARVAKLNPAFRISLGAAQYRVGKYSEARDTLKGATPLIPVEFRGAHPVHLAFLAMTHHRLGDEEAARKTLDQLREVMKTPSWARDNEAQDLAHEAEVLLRQPAPSPSK